MTAAQAPKRKTDYRLGSLFAVSTAFLLATQEPFSFLAAKRLNAVQFVLLTQIALALSIPLLTYRADSRRDFVALLRERGNWGKLAVVFAVGMTGLLLYNKGLANAHPIIIAAVLNLSPFWAAFVALFISGVPIPLRPVVFFGCFAGAFLGAMAVAWSQSGNANAGGEIADSLLRGSWIYAIPVPIMSALGGTLVGKWFSGYDESAAIAANFLVPAVVLIPTTTVLLAQRSQLDFGEAEAVALMMFGTIVAASVGRVLYQVALTTTGADNGFVTMFFLLVPALTGLISWPMSWFIPDLVFKADGAYFLGLALIAASLLLFSWRTWRTPAR